MCANAAFSGHLEILKWARENSCDWDSRVCENAALNGHLKILIWAHENKCPYNKINMLLSNLRDDIREYIINFM